MGCNNGDLKSIKGSLVFWGTGKLANHFFQLYCVERKLLHKPIFWCDNAKEKQGKSMHGIEIISPERLQILVNEYNCNGKKEEQPEVTVIVSVTGIALLQIVCQIEQMALRVKIYSAAQLQAQHYFEENDKAIEEIINMMPEENSRCQYRRMLLNMQQGVFIDFLLYEPCQYIGNDVIPEIEYEEVVVDAGVCEGGEIDKVLLMQENVTIHAFEPDCNSMEVLKNKYENDPRIKLYPYALWEAEEMLSFVNDPKEPAASRLGQDGASGEIKAVSLDMIIEGKVTLIKMDIEGAEYQALLGAAQIIRRYRPKLAICIYHSVEDYVRIPLLIKKLNPDYQFYFRQHSILNAESVIYAI